MEKQRNKEIVVGLISFVAIVLFFVGISIGKGFKVTPDDQMIKIRFPRSGGIQVSEPVVVNGVKRGTVSEVKNDKGSVLVSVTLDGYSDIKSDAAAKITLLEITGGKKIEINPGISENRFSLKNEMPGNTPPDLSDLVSLVGEVSGDAVLLVKRLDTIAGSATELLADGKVVNDIKSTVKNASELSANLNKFVNNNYAKLESSIRNLNDLSASLKTAVDKHEPGVGRIINDIEVTLKEARGLIGNIDSTVTNANVFVSNVNSITSEIRNGNGFVNKLLYDKNLNQRLDSTFTNLADLLYMIKNHGVNVNLRLGSRP